MAIKAIEMNIENFSFTEALKGVMDIARIGNKYINETRSWSEIKIDKTRSWNEIKIDETRPVNEIKINESRTKEIFNTCLQIIAKL